MNWHEEFHQGTEEPLKDYVKRLEAAKEVPCINMVVLDTINEKLKAARQKLRGMKAQLRKTPTIQEGEAARRESPPFRKSSACSLD